MQEVMENMLSMSGGSISSTSRSSCSNSSGSNSSSSSSSSTSSSNSSSSRSKYLMEVLETLRSRGVWISEASENAFKGKCATMYKPMVNAICALGLVNDNPQISLNPRLGTAKNMYILLKKKAASKTSAMQLVPIGQMKWAKMIPSMQVADWDRVWKLLQNLKKQKMLDLHDGMYCMLIKRYLYPKYVVCPLGCGLQEWNVNHTLIECTRIVRIWEAVWKKISNIPFQGLHSILTVGRLSSDAVVGDLTRADLWMLCTVKEIIDWVKAIDKGKNVELCQMSEDNGVSEMLAKIEARIEKHVTKR
jgi:hypothetical protein